MSSHDTNVAIGIDIGGTGIKGASVDVRTGSLISERIKVPTPEGARPDDVIEAVATLFERLSTEDIADAPLGVAFPAVVKHGVTMSAANVSDEWIGLGAEKLFEDALSRDISFLNDADAAGLAELRYGAARDVRGVTLMTTLGTGIGTAILSGGKLVPNVELGHIELDGKDAETTTSNAAREREDLSWSQWAQRLQRYYSACEVYLSPDLIVVGGGVSKHHEHFLPLLDLTAKIVPAKLRNNAGILGAAARASDKHVARV
ncbi:polyphosphate--glucose phosphotransferase [Paramicrobacterium agarici]|uniref:Polyphosphate glucokinase n=1 Tax=Paramicrobacterium agarici TaxID=630514 RepID=A0A2A9DXZ5_9MICO|nr:ROK family protein [Microbacterium agarici]PFG31246.1 polyphosphate glucokinase [Microbacterium agarici]TQO24348.1 polyphosphate glucokinase [Microbacterium agarici]